jgi:hypothetical protein
MEKLKGLWALATKYPFLVLGVVLTLIAGIGVLPIGESSYRVDGPWRWILLAVGGVAICVDSIRNLRGEPRENVPLGPVIGGITNPAPNARMTKAFRANGWVKHIETGHHLWLIVEVGTHKWPKGAEIRVDANGEWQSEVFEDGSGPGFALSLYVADAEGHRKIQAWLDVGALIGYHPFERDIPGTRRLTRVDGLTT